MKANNWEELKPVIVKKTVVVKKKAPAMKKLPAKQRPGIRDFIKGTQNTFSL